MTLALGLAINLAIQGSTRHWTFLGHCSRRLCLPIPLFPLLPWVSNLHLKILPTLSCTSPQEMPCASNPILDLNSCTWGHTGKRINHKQIDLRDQRKCIPMKEEWRRYIQSLKPVHTEFQDNTSINRSKNEEQLIRVWERSKGETQLLNWQTQEEGQTADWMWKKMRSPGNRAENKRDNQVSNRKIVV